MNKTSISQQENLIEPPIVIDFDKLLTESKLSENEQGIVKRRLIENRQAFGKVLQQLTKYAKQETGTFDLLESLKELEEKETREIRSFDAIAKILSRDFPQLLQFILDEYQVEAENTKALIGKEFVFIKRIADVIFEAKDKNGCEVIIHLEFEREYESDEQMDKRKLEYRHLMEMDSDYQGKVILCNVFYLRGSPDDKEMIEDRTVNLPTTDPRYSGELKYKAYHLSLVTIETIIHRNLPFLLPFVVESELRTIDKAPTSRASRYIHFLRQEIDEHEVELTQMIEALTANQVENLRTTVEYLWGKNYSRDVFNKSTLLKLMKEQLNFRQRDIEWGRVEGRDEGRTEGRTEGRAEGRTEGINVLLKLMQQEGKITPEQTEYFIKRTAEEMEKESDKKK